MSVNSNSALSPASLIAAAFKCDDVVATKTTTGIQTMAAAILAHHSEKESRRATVKALSERGEAFNVFKAEIVTAHITARMKSADGKADVVAATNTRNASQMVLLNKGFDLAFALDACGVTLRSFVPGKDGGGLFHVPVSALVANDDTPLGALSVAAKSDKLIPLDGRTYACEREGKFTNIKAFPARVLELAGYKKPGRGKVTAPVVAPSNGASDTTSTGGASAAEIKRDPNTWSLDQLLVAAGDLLNRAADTIADGKSNGDVSGKGEEVEPLGWSDLPEKMRNAIDAVLIFRDECKAVDATQTQAKAA
jgi:hypothetical protein